MPGSLTNEGEIAALDVLFRGQTPPTNLYVGLATNVPESIPVDDATTLATIEEENDAAYTRQAITFTAPADDGNGGHIIKNDGDIMFPLYNAHADKAVTYAFVTDAQSGTTGKIYFWIKLDEAKQPVAGEKLTILSNQLTFSLD